MFKSPTYYFIALFFIMSSCDVEELNEYNFTVFVKNATTGAPEVGTPITIDIINDILGERSVSTSAVTDENGSILYHFKGAHKYVIFKAAEDEYCAEITCDNRTEDSILFYSYALVDVENITNNTDTLHYKIKDSTNDVDVHNMEVHLWVYRCGEININFENIASDKDSSGFALSTDKYKFCASDETLEIDISGKAVQDSLFTFNVYANNIFYWERYRLDSTGSFTSYDSIVIEPNSINNVTIDQSTINSRP